MRPARRTAYRLAGMVGVATPDGCGGVGAGVPRVDVATLPVLPFDGFAGLGLGMVTSMGRACPAGYNCKGQAT